MDFKPGQLTSGAASELNWMRTEVVRLSNLRVAGPTMRIYRGPANIVIESTATETPPQSGSGTGFGSGSGIQDHDLVTVQFDALSDVDVAVDIALDITCVDGKISGTATATTTVTKTYERIKITGPDLSITTMCDVGQACQ